MLEVSKDYICAFFDAEGCLHRAKQWNGSYRVYIEITNTDIEILEAIQRKLDELSIDNLLKLQHKVGEGRNKPVYMITIKTSQSVTRFMTEIGCKSAKKREQWELYKSNMPLPIYHRASKSRRERLKRQTPGLGL